MAFLIVTAQVTSAQFGDFGGYIISQGGTYGKQGVEYGEQGIEIIRSGIPVVDEAFKEVKNKDNML